MRFLLDEDLSQVIAEIGRELGLDVVSVHEIGRRGFTDREQLSLAAAEGRVIVTRNRDDFIRLTIELFHTGEAHRGVVIVPRSLPGYAAPRIAHALRRWHEEHEGADLGTHFIDILDA